jgi:solute carrier family 12 (potassium/chloride transporter), member 4/6
MDSKAGGRVSGPTRPIRLGTFVGVFTPTVLTILGVIMFLRMGWVLGNAGLIGTLLIVVVANIITLITALSMSTLATNMRVGVGGAYYLISRSLGLEVGGAIGIPLYLSQVLSLTLYAFGLAETVRFVWPGAPVALIAAIVVIGVTLVAAQSTELALKAQLPIMAFIAAAIISLVMGAEWGEVRVDMFGPYASADATGFWSVFAVFFPAVTGILAGVSLSGDLEDPGSSIPTGVLAAVCVGFGVYLFVPFVLATSIGGDALKEPLVWTSVASVSWLVMPGLWGAILSSAFGSILGAPRTLQALAEDRLAPHVFSQTDEDTGEPVLGLRFSGGIALLAVLLGDLNAVASWVTVFFLTTYGALNLVACLESLTSDPSFRPRIKTPWWVSMLGAIGCFVAMVNIDPVACFVAIVVEVAIFYVLSRRSLQATWGDVRGGLFMTGARWALMNLREMRFDPRNWRPNILVFSPGEEHLVDLVRVADFFGQHRGIVTVVSMLLGDFEDRATHAAEALQRMTKLLVEAGLGAAFCEVTAVPDQDSGVITIAQSNGMAGLHSNTVLFGYMKDDVWDLARMLMLSRKLSTLDKCTLIYRPGDGPISIDPKQQRNALVWWKGREHNGDLMLLLAHLMVATREWSGTKIWLKTVVASEEEAAEWRREVAEMLPDVRINVGTEVLVEPDASKIRDVIRSQSAEADFVFLGLPIAEPGVEAEVAERLNSLVEGLPPTLFVRNEGPFRGRLV